MQFNKDVEQIIVRSREVAIGLGDSYISSHHFLLSVISSENPLRTIFLDKESDFEILKGSLQKEKLNEVNSKFYLTKEFERSLKISGYYSNVYHEDEIMTGHIVLAMIADKRSFAGNFLFLMGITYPVFEAYLIPNKINRLLRFMGQNDLLIRLGVLKFINNIL